MKKKTREKMKIVILSGGLGERFPNSHYPKPLNLINGKHLIYWVIQSILPISIPIVLIYNVRLEPFDFVNIVQKCFPERSFEFIPIQRNTRGAAETLYLGLKLLVTKNPNDVKEPCLVLDNDNVYNIDLSATLDCLKRLVPNQENKTYQDKMDTKESCSEKISGKIHSFLLCNHRANTETHYCFLELSQTLVSSKVQSLSKLASEHDNTNVMSMLDLCATKNIQDNQTEIDIISQGNDSEVGSKVQRRDIISKGNNSGEESKVHRCETVVWVKDVQERKAISNVIGIGLLLLFFF